MAEHASVDPFVSQLAELCRQHPTRAKWVIVPSHAMGHTLGERLALEGTHWANLRFRTPFDLALETAAPFLVERGIDPLGEELGPALIMRLLTELPPDAQPYFRSLGSHPEMGIALWSSIRELRLADITAAALPAAAFENAIKHAELQALLAAYETWLARTHRADPAAVYAEAVLHGGAGPVRAADVRVELPDTICAPLVRRFLDALPGEKPASAVPRVPGLALPRRLQDVVRDEGETSAPLALLMDPGPTESGPASAGQAGRLPYCSSAGVSPAYPPIDLFLFRAGGREAEIEEVFRRILHAPGGALPFDSVEIACASPDVPFLIWQKAQRYGWPLTLAAGVPITATRPARALLAWCDWIDAGYPASGLRRLFQSGDIRLEIPGGPGSGKAAGLLLASGATWGRGTYATSLAALAVAERGKADDPETEDDSRSRHLERASQAARLATWIDALLAPLPDSDGKTTPSAVRGEALEPRTGETPAHTVPLQPLVSAAGAFVAEHAAKANELDGKAAQAIDTALQDLRALGDPSCPPAYALDLMRAAIEGVAVGSTRARPGHLHVSLLPRAGFAGRPHTFIVGLEEGRVFPSLVEDPVLLDRERQRLHPCLATSEDRLAEAVHTVVSRLAVLPRACLSFSCRDLAENRETFPSWLMLQAFRLIEPGKEVGYEDLNAFLGEPRSVVPPDPGAALADAGWWLANLKHAARPDPAPVFKAFPSLEQGAQAEELRGSGEFTAYDGFVPDAGPVLDPRTSGHPVSPSQLEQTGGCPFAYFLERALGIEAIEEEEPSDDQWLDPARRGTLLHALYADMMRDLRKRRRLPDPERDLPWLLARADERLEQIRSEMPPPSPEVFAYERLEIQRDLGLFLQIGADEASKGTRPIAFEVTFGRDASGESPAAEPLGQPVPITVQISGERFSLAGRIDRIDRLPRGGYEVVDYKTGSFYRKKYKGTFRQGRQLQLVLYAIAAETLLRKAERDPKLAVVSGRYLFPTLKGGGDDKRIVRPDDGVTGTVLSDLFETLSVGAFTVTPDKEDCAFCPFGPACGGEIANKRAKKKLEEGTSAALDPFRRLRSHA